MCAIGKIRISQQGRRGNNFGPDMDIVFGFGTSGVIGKVYNVNWLSHVWAILLQDCSVHDILLHPMFTRLLITRQTD